MNDRSIPELLTEHDVARVLKLSLTTIRRRRMAGQAPQPLKIGGSIRYTPESISSLIEQSKAEASQRVA